MIRAFAPIFTLLGIRYFWPGVISLDLAFVLFGHLVELHIELFYLAVGTRFGLVCEKWMS